MKTIIFDFGSVLFNIDYWNLYRKYFTTSEEYEYFYTQVLDKQARKNSYLANAYPILKDLAKKYPDYHDPLMATYYEYNQIITDTVLGMENLLASLEVKGIAMYGLTNWAADNYETLKRYYPHILDYLDGVVVSGQEGIAKPDPEFYQILLRRYQIDPASAVFIDDKQINVDAATQLGMDGKLFKDAKTLTNYLNTHYQLDISGTI